MQPYTKRVLFQVPLHSVNEGHALKMSYTAASRIWDTDVNVQGYGRECIQN